MFSPPIVSFHWFKLSSDYFPAICVIFIVIYYTCIFSTHLIRYHSFAIDFELIGISIQGLIPFEWRRICYTRFGSLISLIYVNPFDFELNRY